MSDSEILEAIMDHLGIRLSLDDSFLQKSTTVRCCNCYGHGTDANRNHCRPCDGEGTVKEWHSL